MTVLNFDVVYRLLTRAAEIAAEPEMHPSVISVYNGILKAPAEACIQAHEAIAEAEGACARARREAAEALDGLDPHYKVARAVVLAFLPDVVLPDTLKSLATDTDKLNAIAAVLKAINDNASEAWAAGLLAGPFGASGPKAADALKAAVASSKALSKARDERGAAVALAHAKFVPWKRVVREALGSRSVQYRRIHITSGRRPKAAKADAPSPSPSPSLSPSPSAAPSPSPAQPPSPAPVLPRSLEATPGAAPSSTPAP